MTDELRTTQPANRLNTVPDYREAIVSLQARRDLVLQLMESVLVLDTHYGKIPGCGDKPSLFLPGAEQLSSTFGYAPRYKKNLTREGMHLIADVTCELYLPDGTFVAEGTGMCSTFESKYRYRGGVGESTGQAVPKKYWTLKETDRKAAQELIGGAGYSTKKIDGSWEICKTIEKMENPDPSDQWNTVVKMGCKRAFVHAVRTATGTADVFTQDIEDFRDSYGTVIDVEVMPPASAPTPTPPSSEPAKTPAKTPAAPAPAVVPPSTPEPPENDAPWPDEDGGAPVPSPAPAPAPEAPKPAPKPAVAPKPRATAAPAEDVNSEAYAAKARASIVAACKRFEHAYVIQNVKDPKAEVLKVKTKITETVRFPDGVNEFQRRAMVAEAMQKRADYLGFPPLPKE
jgi:hypothetical protein